MEGIIELISGSEEWLMRRLHHYASRQGYVRYTSTLEEAWRISIQGVSAAIVRALQLSEELPEFTPEDDFGTEDPIAAFGNLEASRHRERGVDLPMFLGLFKYYRQIYQDLIAREDLHPDRRDYYALYLQRIFDRIEIGFCSQWVKLSEDERVAELQNRNRLITNEKNKLLTIIESLANPVILLNDHYRIEYLNGSAAGFLGLSQAPGSFYYHREEMQVTLPVDLDARIRESRAADVEEFQYARTMNGSCKEYQVQLTSLRDYSERSSGFAVIILDITRLKETELDLEKKRDELEKLSMIDSLTGLYNRRGLKLLTERQMHLAERTGIGFHLLYGDMDNLKKINDSLGHHIGDQALIHLAEIFRENFRESDILARIGGDEFVVLLTDSNPLEPEFYTRRLHERLEAHLNVPFRLSISIGTVHWDPECNLSFEELLIQADQLMYLEKKSRQESDTLPPFTTGQAWPNLQQI